MRSLNTYPRFQKIQALFLYAESEVASINMVYGAAAAGKE